jgi:hypothetical protein
VTLALSNYDNLQHLIVLYGFYGGLFFEQMHINGCITGVAIAIPDIHPQSYPQLLCIKIQIAYATPS